MNARSSSCWILIVLFSALGCGGAGLPKTHPVKGRVVYKDGNIKWLQGATVEFESVSNPELAAEGEVQADGAFSITTTSNDGSRMVEGALPGEHRVRVIPPNPREQGSQYLIDPRLQKFQTSGLKVQIPTDSEIIIEVHRPRR